MEIFNLSTNTSKVEYLCKLYLRYIPSLILKKKLSKILIFTANVLFLTNNQDLSWKNNIYLIPTANLWRQQHALAAEDQWIKLSEHKSGLFVCGQTVCLCLWQTPDEWCSVIRSQSHHISISRPRGSGKTPVNERERCCKHTRKPIN